MAGMVVAWWVLAFVTSEDYCAQATIPLHHGVEKQNQTKNKNGEQNPR